MKTLLSFAFAMTLMIGTASVSSAQDAVSAEGAFTVGAGITYGTEVGGGEMGIEAQAFYGITNEIRAGAGFVYYMIGTDGVSASEINIDGHYLFVNEDGLVLYGLAGLSFASMSFDTGFGNMSTSDTGFNLGGGVEYSLGSVAIYGEPRYTVGGFEQLSIAGGVRMRF